MIKILGFVAIIIMAGAFAVISAFMEKEK